MGKWCTRCSAVWWTAVLFLLVASSLGQTTENEGNFEGTPFYTETTTGYTTEITTDPTTPNTEAPEDPQRSERMVVFVKVDPKADTKNITEFLDSDDIVYTTGENETIVITDTESGDDELTHDDGDLMIMAGRSLNDHDKLSSQAEGKQQPNSINREVNLKSVLNKWSTEIDFNLSDLLKVNLASLLADDYDEMNRLMNQNLVEDDTNESMEATITDSLEPRDVDSGILNTDQAVAASSEVVRQVLPVPASTSPHLRLRGSAEIVPQYTYPLYSHVQRSDMAPSYVFLPRSGNSPIALQPTGNTLRLPMPTSFQRTVVQPATTLAPPRLIRRPQNQTTTRSPTRFGERFVGRLPRPFHYMLNMTVGGRQTTTEKPPVRPSIVSYLPSASQSYPARQRAPNRYYQRPTTRYNAPSPTRIQGAVSTTESRTTTKTQVTTTAPSSTEFGARVRPFRYDRERNSTIITQNGNKKKANKEVKINRLRSNLVGKLVVMQSIMNEKQEKKGNVVKLASTQLNRKGLPYGILKPIVPLRPRTNFETTTSLTETTTASNPVTTTELGLKEKKKYRRPPSFRKGGSYKLSAEKQTEEGVTSNTAKLRESMVIQWATEATAPSWIANTTENSVQSLDVNDQRTLPLPVTVMSDVNETSTEITNKADTATSTTEDTIVGFEHEITIKSVDTSPTAITTKSISGLHESTLSATETTVPRGNDEQSASSTTLKQLDTSFSNLDLHGTTTTTVENTTETPIQNDKQTSSVLKMVHISVAAVDVEGTTAVAKEENALSTKTDEEVRTTTPEVAFTLFQDTKLHAETATQSLLKTGASTDAHLNHTSMTAERANKDGEINASSGKNKIVLEGDFSNDDDSFDDESDFDFLDDEPGSVVKTNEERLRTDNELSRFDRLVRSASKEHSKMAEDSFQPLRSQNIFSAVNLARGEMRPINLPYNILPTNEVTTTR